VSDETSARIRRRSLLRVLAALPGAVAFEGGCHDASTSKPPPPPTPTPFLSKDEQAVLAALADAVLPPDDEPGGSALGAVAYIERVLTAFDVSPPAIFAGGPYSNRNPFPDANGNATTTFPPNEFAQFLALDRYGEAAWKLTILGSSGVPGGGPNDAALGPIPGWRAQVKSAIAQATQAAAGAPFSTLTPVQVAGIYKGLDQDLRDLLYDLVCEAAFAAPEYGGNPGLAGWKLTHFDGDVMPFGFSQYDAATKSYHERADAPVSMPNPGPDPEPVTAATWTFVQEVVQALGGMEFM
jgi:hypothetical protein